MSSWTISSLAREILLINAMAKPEENAALLTLAEHAITNAFYEVQRFQLTDNYSGNAIDVILHQKNESIGATLYLKDGFTMDEESLTISQEMVPATYWDSISGNSQSGRHIKEFFELDGVDFNPVVTSQSVIYIMGENVLTLDFKPELIDWNETKAFLIKSAKEAKRKIKKAAA